MKLSRHGLISTPFYVSTINVANYLVMEWLLKDNTGFFFNGSSTNSSRDGVQIRNPGIFPNPSNTLAATWYGKCLSPLSVVHCLLLYMEKNTSTVNFLSTSPTSKQSLILGKGTLLRRLIWWYLLDCRHRWEKHQKGKTRRIGNGSSWGKGTDQYPLNPNSIFSVSR